MSKMTKRAQPGASETFTRAEFTHFAEQPAISGSPLKNIKQQESILALESENMQLKRRCDELITDIYALRKALTVK